METCFSKHEVVLYLRFIESNRKMMNFLEYDSCFRLADNYLLAMVFIYFKRAGLKSYDFSLTTFFAALLLAHAIVEENDEHTREIMIWALPTIHDHILVAQMETVKLLMFQAMGFRGYASKDCCNQVMSAAPHELWSKRQRNALHGGTFRNIAQGSKSKEMYDWETASCESCRYHRKTLYQSQ